MMNQISKWDQEWAKKSANLMLATPWISFAVDMVVGLAIWKFFSKALKSINWSKVSKPDLSKIENISFKNAINDIYRDAAEIWNKSTADAIRYTKATWIKVWWSDHIDKWLNSISRLENLLKSWKLNEYERGMSTKIISDIKNAIHGK